MAAKTGTTSPILTSLVIASRFLSVWIALALLIVVAYFVAPATLSSTSFSSVLPLTGVLAIAALGQMLVIMTGGIDLSIPGIITLASLVVVGVSGKSDDQLVIGIIAALVVAGLAGLLNGLLIGVLKLNALIVTLAVGGIIYGMALAYGSGIAREASVPPMMAAMVRTPFLGIASLFWISLVVTILIVLLFRYTVPGRKFQAVGANPRAAWIVGIHVDTYEVLAYVFAGLLYGLTGILLAGFLQSPSLVIGQPYLLGPIAAVVIGGAALTGGLASATSTWAAAFFLILLSQMLRVMGLPTSLQFVVFGLAIIGGMVISGDRIVTAIENVFRGRTV